MTPKKWQLLSKKDISPHAWFPIEMRSYKIHNGNIIHDFSVTTIPDVSMIVPITDDGKVVLVNQFKPGVDEVILEFPAGRIEAHHTDFEHLAMVELEEETGIRVARTQLTHFATLAGFTTKGSERLYVYLARNCIFNSKQKPDVTEDIEVVTLTIEEMDAYILNGKIWAAQTIAAWFLAKQKFQLSA